MPTIPSFPYNPTNIVAPDMADDGGLKKWMEFVRQCMIQSGWVQQTDAGYAQQFNQAMAFSTMSNAGTGITTGGTLSTAPANYPNNAMDNSTATFWNSNGEPTLNGLQPAIGYDAGVGATVNPVYYNLWLAGSGSSTDPTCWVLEYADTMDSNYSWAGATWTAIQSFVSCSTVTGNLSVCSVALTPGGTGWIVNTAVSSITSAGGGKGAVIQPIVTPSGGPISGYLIASPGVNYSVGDTLVFATSGSGSGAAATVGSVNAAGQILTINQSSGGTAYVCNPIATGTGGTGTSTFAVFTNSAIGIAGAIQQVIPCLGSVGYAAATPPTVTITQPTGGSTPTSAPTCTAKLSMSTGGAAQLNRFDIATQFWTSVSSPSGPTHRAFRLRLLANVSSTTTCDIYEFQLVNYAGTYVNQSPPRLGPTTVQTNTQVAWMLFQMADTIQSTYPAILRVSFGSGATWSAPSLWLTLCSATDGSGNAIGSNATTAMQITSGVATAPSTVAPLWAISNGNVSTTDCWAHIELFKSTASEIVFHIERKQTVSGADDSTSTGSVQLLGASTSGTQAVEMPNNGAAPSIESYWGLLPPSNAGSTNGSVTQIRPIVTQNRGASYPLRRLFGGDITGSALPDGTVFTLTDPYGNSVTGFMGGVQCTKITAVTTNTSFRMAVKATV